MTATPQPHVPDAQQADGSTISPLPGEPGIPDVAAPPHSAVSRKGVLAVAVLVLSLVMVSSLAIHRFASNGRRPSPEDRLLGDKPAAAGTEPRKLEMPARPPGASAPPSAPRVPALLPIGNEEIEPIGVRRTGAPAAAGAGQAGVSPLDAPVLLVSTRPLPSEAAAPSSRMPRDQSPDSDDGLWPPGKSQDPLAATSQNLQAYQRQLQGLLDSLTRSADLATRDASSGALSSPAAPIGMPPPAPSDHAPAGLFGGQLQGSATPRVPAALLGNRSLTLPKGTAFPCALKTRVISAASGLVGCQVQRHVYSDDGRVLLIERGSHLDGEYRVAAVRPGMVRIPVLWTRLRTPLGVTVEIGSPATGQLGESGIDGYVDNRWTERLGAAMLLSLIDDSVKLVIQNQANERQGDTIVLPSTTANTGKLAEKVLDSTINIPPLVYRNQGGIVGIHVARDLDFSTVYELVPSSAGPHRP